jgi:hypothetical protein
MIANRFLSYYLDVAPCVRHHVRNRPMQMKRYPNGVEGEFFHQKRVPVPHPDWLDTTTAGFLRTEGRLSRLQQSWLAWITSAASSYTRDTRALPTSSGPTTCSSTSIRVAATRGLSCTRSRSSSAT